VSASVLLIEDEALIRMMLVEMIEEAGHSVVAEAGNVTKGAALATEAEFDLAILDINLGGDTIEPIASAITSRGKPFFFVSGYGSSGVPDAFRGTPVVRKPCLLAELQTAIDAALSQVPVKTVGPI
jgi:CheY-like chemotaxis protein